MSEPFHHVPVCSSVCSTCSGTFLAGTVVDATLGGAGHATALLDQRPDLGLLGIDRDPDALAAAQLRLASYGDRVHTAHARFDQLADVVTAAGPAIQPIVGVLFDLGVSSPQLDRADAGSATATMLRSTCAWTDRRAVGRRHRQHVRRDRAGTGPPSLRRRALRRPHRPAIVAARPIATTTELADARHRSDPRAGPTPRRSPRQAHVPGAAHRGQRRARRPAGRARRGDRGAGAGRPGRGLSYHSGEDRIVKERFRRADDGGCTCPPGLPCVCGAVPTARLLKRGGWVPSRRRDRGQPPRRERSAAGRREVARFEKVRPMSDRAVDSVPQRAPTRPRHPEPACTSSPTTGPAHDHDNSFSASGS